MEQTPIAFIGGGHMGTSIITGLIKSGFKPEFIWVADPNLEKRERFIKDLHIHATASDSEAAEKCDIIVLAVKPQDIKKVIEDIKGVYSKRTPLLISLAAGIQTDQLNRWLGNHYPIIRAMPNTPALLRAGASALYANSKATDEQKNQAESILRSVGITVWVSHEHDMDTVTALSGSGPAYYFLVMEALQEGAEKLGLSSSTAKLLSLQTALGAARMALESDIPIENLIKKVASKGGTTEKALEVLEEASVRQIFEQALKKAKERALEISQHFDKE